MQKYINSITEFPSCSLNDKKNTQATLDHLLFFSSFWMLIHIHRPISLLQWPSFIRESRGSMASLCNSELMKTLLTALWKIVMDKRIHMWKNVYHCIYCVSCVHMRMQRSIACITVVHTISICKGYPSKRTNESPFLFPTYTNTHILSHIHKHTHT